jgi:uncharacterized protein (TIGR00369 family)
MLQMSGLEFLQAIVRGDLPQPPIGDVFNFDLLEVEKGRVVFAGTPDRRFYNPIGSVHGGYAATLLDSCMGCAVHSILDAGVGYTTLEFKVQLVRAMTEETGLVRAEGTVLHSGRRTATAHGELRDRSGRLLAHGSTTCIILSA